MPCPLHHTHIPNSVGEVLQHDVLYSHIVWQYPHPKPSLLQQGPNHANLHLVPLLHLPPVLQHQAGGGVHQVGHLGDKAAARPPREGGRGGLAVGSTAQELLPVAIEEAEFVLECSSIACQKVLQREETRGDPVRVLTGFIMSTYCFFLV